MFISYVRRSRLSKPPFIKWQRTKEVAELMKKPDCFMLLAQIAYRAKRTSDFNTNNLKIGEALIGDFKEIGLTEQRYRSAKSNVQTWGLATFKGTNKGTVAKLVDTRIYDINEENNNGQNNRTITSQQRTNNEPITTNKNEKNEKNEKNVIKEAQEKMLTDEKIKLTERSKVKILKDYLKNNFEKSYRLFSQPKNIKVIPYDLLTKYNNCLTKLGSSKEVDSQIVDYLDYLKTTHWRDKKSFSAWINQPELYGDDWKAKKKETENQNKKPEAVFSFKEEGE